MRCVAALLFALAGCATSGPDPTIDPRGSWSVVAIDDQPTGGGAGFTFAIDQTQGSARFGCNGGGGAIRIDRGRIVTGNWIVTAASCIAQEPMCFERLGFDIISQPMAIAARPGGGLRLSNRVGTIDLVREDSLTIDPVGEWVAVAVDGVATSGGSSYAVTITRDNFRGYFGCNLIDGGYRMQGARFVRTGSWRMTEKGCFDPSGKRDILAIEERAFVIVLGRLGITRPAPDALRLQSERGSIDLVRKR